MPYEIGFSAEYNPTPSRLSSFFRLILLIPLIAWFLLYSLAAAVVIIIAWFALLFTARFPQGLYRFVYGYTCFYANLLAYSVLLTDRFPPLLNNDQPYPIALTTTGPLDRYSRARVLFRAFIGLPLAIMQRYAIEPLLAFAGIGAWFMILFTGRLTPNLHDILQAGVAYRTRSQAYLSLLTERYPPFAGDLRWALRSEQATGTAGAQRPEQP